MPAGLIHLQDDERVLELACQGVQEKAHPLGVRGRQHQGAEPPKPRAHRSKNRDKLADDLPWHLGPNRLGSPIAPGSVDTPKVPFVLDHHPYRAAVLSLSRGQNGGYLLGKVF